MIKLFASFAVLVLLMFSLLSNNVYSQDAVKVGRSVIAGGGGKSTTSLYRSSGTIGQALSGRSNTNSYKLGSGFWTGPFAGTCCIGATGDLDADGNPSSILDLTFIIDNIYRGGEDPICLFEGDLDGDGSKLSVTDMTYMIDFIFRGGEDPVSCP